MLVKLLLPGRQSSKKMFLKMEVASGAALCVKDLDMRVSKVCVVVLAEGINSKSRLRTTIITTPVEATFFEVAPRGLVKLQDLSGA
jgi:hypothetical protein